MMATSRSSSAQSVSGPTNPGQDVGGHGQSDVDFHEDMAKATLAELATGPSARPSNPGQEEEVVLMCCKYQCGPPQPAANGFRANRHAAWVCKPCYNAQQALANACRKDEQAKVGMLEMQAKDPEQWAAKVRSLRIAAAPGQTGVANKAVRKAKMHECVREVGQFVTVKTVGGTKWLTRTAWAHYMVKHYGQDFNESLAKFDVRAKDAGVDKMQVPGEPIRVPVMMAPETVVEHGRTLQAKVSSSSRVNSVLEMKEALQDVANVGKDASVLATASFGETAAVFRPGAIEGHQSGQPVPFGFGQPAPVSTVANEEDFQGLMKRHEHTAEELAKQEGGQEAKKRRTTTSKAKPGLGGVTGQILKQRTEGYARLEALLANFGQVKTNMAKKVKDKYKVGEEMTKEVADTVNKYEANLKQAGQLKDSIANWTLSTGQGKLLVVTSLEEDLAKLRDDLQEVLEQRLAKSRQQRKANFARVQEQNRAKKGACKPFVDLGHTTLANWLYSKGALVAKDVAPGSKEEEGHRTLTRRKSDTAQDNDMSYRKVKVCTQGDNYWEPKTPTFFPANEEGLAKTLGQLRHAYGDKADKLGQDLFKNFEEANDVLGAMKAMPAQGGPADSVGQLHWLPEQFRSQEQGPGQLNTFGAGWIVLQKVGAVRYHPEHFPFGAGLGQFLHVVDGPFVVGLYPSGSMVERGCVNLANAYHWVSSLGQDHFDTWANENLAYAVMQPGSTLWVPYGYHALSVATHWSTSSTEDIKLGVNTMILQPYMQAKFARETTDANLGMEMAKAAAASYLAKNSKAAKANEYVAMHAKAYSEWLHMVSGANLDKALTNGPETERANNSEQVKMSDTKGADDGANEDEKVKDKDLD